MTGLQRPELYARTGTHPQHTTAPVVPMLLMQIQQSFFCIDLHDIIRTLLLVDLQSIPRGPNYLAGFMNVAGASIPVIDLSLRLGMDNPEPYTLETPIIICMHHESPVAFIVNNIIGIETINVSDLHAQPMFKDSDLPYSASLALPEGQALVLDLNRVLDIELGSISCDNGSGKDGEAV